ncbi:hypothetical protein K443DRAFT_4683 [Laccaria amethystina LaAM-08-1]|uniref:T6SS Phospholipase effector Tle1-like catalytic domain-containing protein n=1 Tax=Laccaria amethystina LaAM-08-1 TaxID=1095629 RepID=A0A0C9WXB0_9AGAR|nr:hypothetical protein K443DRAFT_4683 [Laccaria amethystina LaAM-08-1]
MSSSFSPSFVLAKDNPIEKNNTPKIRQYSSYYYPIRFGQQLNYKSVDDETRNADLTDLRPSGVDPTSKTASDKPCMPCGHKLNGRNLIVCIDGASNQFGEKNTNVIELYNLILKNEDDNQRTWYNSGIGTYARPSWKSLSYYKKVLYHKIDLAIGWDFKRIVLGAYRWLSDNYEKDDCIFLFGFSRGAFQVRVLSAMIEKVGLVYRGAEMQIPFAYELYVNPKSGERPASDVGDTDGQEDNMTMAARFKNAFSNENVKVHFVGAWDTVSSIAIARGKSMFPGTVDGMTHVCYFRHALALDERRVKFLPEYAYGGSAKPLEPINNTRGNTSSNEEVWFSGTHSDIGGGSVKNAAMDRARPPLRWMVFEAGAAGLRTARFERELLAYEQINIIKSLTWPWLFFEICPLKRLTFTRKENGLPEMTRWPHLGKGRKIHRGQKIHTSLVRARGSTAENYIPQARPFDNDPSFWDMLRDEGKEPTANVSEWLELDLDEERKLAVEKQVTEGEGDAPEAVYRNAIEALHQEPTLENKYLLLQTTMQVLKRSSRDDLDFKLSLSSQIRPLLSDLFCYNSEYRRTALDFVVLFTNFVNIVQLKGDYFSSCAISPDETRIASVTGTVDGNVRIWDAETGCPVGEPLGKHYDWVWSVAFSPDGRRMVSGSEDTTVRIWDAETGSPVGEPLRGHNNWVSSVAFSPNGRRIASCSFDKTVRIWDAETGSPVGEPLRGHEYWVNCVAFSPDGARIVSGSDDRTVWIWDAETGSPVGEPLRGHVNYVWSVAFSPDGTRIVSGSEDRTVRIWDAETGSPVGQPLEGHNDWVTSVAFSPDGTRIVSGSGDRTVRIWDTEAGSPVGEPLRGHTGCIQFVAFSRDIDYGKITLVDQLLRQSGTIKQLTATEQLLFTPPSSSSSSSTSTITSDSRLDDASCTPTTSNARVVLSRCTGVIYNDNLINIVDPPGHADIEGTDDPEVGLVKALGRGFKLVVLNKADRETSRPAQVESDLFDLFATLRETDEQADYPLLYASKQGWARDTLPTPSTDLASTEMTMTPLS